MKIISIRQGFTADHSSTSYKFLAVDRPLEKEDREVIASLSSRVNPTKRRASFIYHVDGYDIPGGWERLMTKYYDVMCSQDYEWWTLAMAFPTSSKEQHLLSVYELSGVDDLGIRITHHDERTIVRIYCILDYSYLQEPLNIKKIDYKTEDVLLNLLTVIRRQLIDGDYRALDVVWRNYGEDEESPPESPDREGGEEVLQRFDDILDFISF